MIIKAILRISSKVIPLVIVGKLFSYPKNPSTKLYEFARFLSCPPRHWTLSECALRPLWRLRIRVTVAIHAARRHAGPSVLGVLISRIGARDVQKGSGWSLGADSKRRQQRGKRRMYFAKRLVLGAR